MSERQHFVKERSVNVSLVKVCKGLQRLAGLRTLHLSKTLLTILLIWEWVKPTFHVEIRCDFVPGKYLRGPAALVALGLDYLVSLSCNYIHCRMLLVLGFNQEETEIFWRWWTHSYGVRHSLQLLLLCSQGHHIPIQPSLDIWTPIICSERKRNFVSNEGFLGPSE